MPENQLQTFQSKRTLSPGVQAPGFSLPSHRGESISLASLSGRCVILFFLRGPSDDKCLQDFSVSESSTERLVELNTILLGIGRDIGDSHREFPESGRSPFSLLRDEDGAVSRAYGVSNDLHAPSRVFLIGPEGRILKVYGVEEPQNTFEHALRDLARLNDEGMFEASRRFENKVIGKTLDDYFTDLESVKGGILSYSGERKISVDALIAYLETSRPHHVDGRSRNKSSFSIREIMIAREHLKRDATEMVRYLTYRYLFNESVKSFLETAYPTVLVVEPTSICNLKCTMCMQSDDSFRKDKSFLGVMDFDLYKKIIDEAAQEGLCSLVIAPRGEPTLHPRIADMVRYAKEKGILEVKMNSNATRLTEELSRKLLESGLDTMVFSVDSYVKDRYEKIRINANFDQVLSNIKRFHRIKTELNSKTRTRISMLLIDPNDDVDEAEAFWAPWVDEFAAGHLRPIIDIYNYVPFEDDKACGYLWERAMVWWDGKVNPCEQDYKSVLSKWNVRDQGLKEIWQSPEYQAIRRTHKAGQKSTIFPCDRCHSV